MPRNTEQHIFFVGADPAVLKTVCEVVETLGVKIICFTDPAKCLEHVRCQRCDLLIVDMNVPQMGGIELLRRTKQLTPSVPVLIISDCGDIPTVVEAMKAGAEDFIEKPLHKKNLPQKVKSILQEGNTSSDACGGERLTQTEMSVLKLVADGQTSKKIAESLHRSIRTVQFHRAILLQKLGVKNSVALVRRAWAMGLIDARPGRAADKTTKESKKKPRDL